MMDQLAKLTHPGAINREKAVRRCEPERIILDNGNSQLDLISCNIRWHSGMFTKKCSALQI